MDKEFAYDYMGPGKSWHEAIGRKVVRNLHCHGDTTPQGIVNPGMQKVTLTPYHYIRDSIRVQFGD